MGVELYISSDDAKAFFHLLQLQKEEIEAEIGGPVDWMSLPDRKGSRIVLYKADCDATHEDDWPSQHAWFAETLEQFDATFRQRVKSLDAADWRPDEETTE